MKNTYALLVFLSTGLNAAFAQNLIFDNTFNFNAPHNDILLNPTDEGVQSYGDVQHVNDSAAVYYVNSINWISNTVTSRAYVKTIHSDGSISVDQLCDFNENYSMYGPDTYCITDVVQDPGDGVFVLRNEPYFDNGTMRSRIHIYAYEFTPIGWMVNLTWGTNGEVTIESTGVSLLNAKGNKLGNLLALAYDIFQGTTGTIGTSIVSNQGAYGVQFIMANPNNTYSAVADLIAISTSEFYIADNAYTVTNSAGVYSYNDLPRILKWNPVNGVLSSDYTGNGAGISATMPWSTQTNTPSIQDRISRIEHENGKILVAGTTKYYDGSPYALNRGRVTKLDVDGTIDNSFGVNGTFANDFTSSYFRWNFNDIDGTSDGSYFLSGGGTLGNSPSDPAQCFILKLDASGNLITSLGNNGFLFENANYSEINSLNIRPGATSLNDQFVFVGMNNGPGAYESLMGRLVWSNGGTTGFSEAAKDFLTVYPNPATSELTIAVQDAATLQIVNLLGEIEAEIELHPGAQTMDIRGLKSGVYVLRSKDGQFSGTVRFVKL